MHAHTHTHKQAHAHTNTQTCKHIHACTHTHTNTHTQTHMQKQIILLPLSGTLTWRSQAVCAFSRHSEPMLANSWRVTRRRTDHLSQAMVWAPKVPPEPRLIYVPICSWVSGGMVLDGLLTPHGGGERGWLYTPNQLGYVGDLKSCTHAPMHARKHTYTRKHIYARTQTYIHT